MKDQDLCWRVESSRQLLHTPVFDVTQQREVSATGLKGDYIAVEAPDWVMVVPETEGQFVLVRQWRHAAESLSLEFPGGVVDGGEEPIETARRELLEETGFLAGELVPLGACYSNPALFKNRVHVFWARDLVPTGTQNLDEDELLTYELKPVDEVIRSFGGGEYTHALMGTAMALYLCRKQ